MLRNAGSELGAAPHPGQVLQPLGAPAALVEARGTLRRGAPW